METVGFQNHLHFLLGVVTKTAMDKFGPSLSRHVMEEIDIAGVSVVRAAAYGIAVVAFRLTQQEGSRVDLVQPKYWRFTLYRAVPGGQQTGCGPPCTGKNFVLWLVHGLHRSREFRSRKVL